MILASSSSHRAVTGRLLVVSAVGFWALAALAVLLQRQAETWGDAWLAPVVTAQGLWLYRLYVVGHEGVHRKLLPGWPVLNDLLASLALLPVGAPLSIYRKVHHFHHGSNRRDDRHAALDHFHVRLDAAGQVGPIRRVYYRAVWLFYVFAGGFFLHSLVTILLFLVVPTRLAVRIDPVFRGWTLRSRLRAWLELGGAVLFHLAFARWLGGAGWVAALGVPLLVFAWVWSLLLYIYHYRTSVGPGVRHNVRSLPRQPLLSWLLLNFNEHVTHHADPSIPWYQLPARRVTLPAQQAGNQNVDSVWAAIWQQRRGPILVDRRPVTPVTPVVPVQETGRP